MKSLLMKILLFGLLTFVVFGCSQKSPIEGEWSTIRPVGLDPDFNFNPVFEIVIGPADNQIAGNLIVKGLPTDNWFVNEYGTTFPILSGTFLGEAKNSISFVINPWDGNPNDMEAWKFVLELSGEELVGVWHEAGDDEDATNVRFFKTDPQGSNKPKSQHEKE